jgi:GH18 family chitinase
MADKTQYVIDHQYSGIMIWERSPGTVMSPLVECIMLKSRILNSALTFILSLMIINDSIAQINGDTALKISDNGHYFPDKNNRPFYGKAIQNGNFFAD